MLGWDAIALARKYEAVKIRQDDWGGDQFIWFCSGLKFLTDEKSEQYTNASVFSENNWEIYYCPHPVEKIDGYYDHKDKFCEVCTVCNEELKSKEVKTITWYRPSIIWYYDEPYPSKSDDGAFFKSKELAIKTHEESPLDNEPNNKYLSWQTFDAPENYEDIE